jgi:hypothetical protein
MNKIEPCDLLFLALPHGGRPENRAVRRAPQDCGCRPISGCAMPGHMRAGTARRTPRPNSSTSSFTPPEAARCYSWRDYVSGISGCNATASNLALLLTGARWSARRRAMW